MPVISGKNARHLQQTGFNPDRIVRQLVATHLPVVEQPHPVQRGWPSQDQTLMAQIPPVNSMVS
jgi:hypothetical protein